MVNRPMPPATATIGLSGEQPRQFRRIASSALVGLFCAWATLQWFGTEAGWMMAPGLVVAIVVAEVAAAIAISLTALPMKLATGSAEFWGGGTLTRAIVAASTYGCASIASGMALILLFATPGFSGR